MRILKRHVILLYIKAFLQHGQIVCFNVYCIFEQHPPRARVNLIKAIGFYGVTIDSNQTIEL